MTFMPDLIPDNLPDEIMAVIVMTSPALLADDTLEQAQAAGSVVGEGALAAGIQVQLNCPLELAVIGLRGLLASLERDLDRRRTARSN
jgi:hypothetical protein